MAEKATPGIDEEELIRRAKAYEADAFTEIYDRYYQSIFTYIYYRVDDTLVAEDLAADVFVKALDAIHSFTFRGVPFSAWLYRIAGNLVIDHFRRRPNAVVGLDESFVARGDGLHEDVERRLTREELRLALKNLTEEQQQVVVLKFVDGLSNAEVAEVMGKSEGAIKALQHRAVVALGRIMGANGSNAEGI
ncbi:MAG: sigma-70 family RNA polymerase sigma factor [Chloroflexi bacterium]|nr:sigma-70 family RNA polymerase sigma factor [Chloroflexota bacterium]